MSSDRPAHLGLTRIDVDALMSHVDSLRRSATPDTRGRAVELYHRAAWTRTATLDGATGAIATRCGDDQGLAIRMATPRGADAGFASVSGSRLASLRWALARCRGRAGLEGEALWARGLPEDNRDLDAEPALPSPEWLANWLERARERLDSDGPPPLELSVEAATTVETWLADGGLRVARSRSRGWALLRTRRPWARDRVSKPVLIARRRWKGLPPEGLREVLEDRRLPDGPEQPPPDRAVPVLFNPECSAILVLALVKALHVRPGTARFGVGPAWKVCDDPRAPEALSGGTFDDAGFPTGPLELADGRMSTGSIEGPGRFRRASYRDRPVAMPFHLVVSASGDEPPERGVVVTSLDLHPVEPHRWLLRIEGAHLETGRPVALTCPSFVATAPEDLVQRCAGAVGPPRLSHLGVETPALVFDGLTLERSTGSGA